MYFFSGHCWRLIFFTNSITFTSGGVSLGRPFKCCRVASTFPLDTYLLQLWRSHGWNSISISNGSKNTLGNITGIQFFSMLYYFLNYQKSQVFACTNAVLVFSTFGVLCGCHFVCFKPNFYTSLRKRQTTLHIIIQRETLK